MNKLAIWESGLGRCWCSGKGSTDALDLNLFSFVFSDTYVYITGHQFCGGGG